MQSRSLSSNFVLVHGAWHGGWCWSYVRKILEAHGHRVLTPSLTGLGDRSHLLSDAIGLGTHIADIANLLEFEDLRDVTLVGHSYGGMIITGVADALKERLSRIVYLDAGLPTNGQSFATIGASTEEEIELAKQAIVALSPDGVRMPNLPATLFGIPADDKQNIDWVNSRLTPHPLATWLDPIELSRGGSEGLARTFIHCTEPVLENSSIPFIAKRISADPSWSYHKLKTGHNAMITAPQALAEILLAG